ncbi:MAG: hypothetical protein M5U09_22525 [Gammaproteobacteria bacterium]|nr:hypothetical protein [Gammaproteobacteria bacterium]
MTPGTRLAAAAEAVDGKVEAHERLGARPSQHAHAHDPDRQIGRETRTRALRVSPGAVPTISVHAQQDREDVTDDVLHHPRVSDGSTILTIGTSTGDRIIGEQVLDPRPHRQDGRKIRVRGKLARPDSADDGVFDRVRVVDFIGGGEIEIGIGRGERAQPALPFSPLPRKSTDMSVL